MKKQKYLVLLLTAALCVGSMSGCGLQKSENAISQTANEFENLSEHSDLADVVEKVINAGSSTAKKEETVYVKTSSDGSVNQIIVSDWLKNYDSTEELKDTSKLTNITNVKGSETYVMDGDNLVWKANGSDIYYQGTIDKELPVEMNIFYELNGKAINPTELAGKSGHVKMTIGYINHESRTVTIGDREETIFTPYVAVSGMRLDNTRFSNVEAVGGNVISDGNNAMVIGMAFPGLADSLNGGKVESSELLAKLEEKMSIPSEIVVEADVNNFELGMVFTMVSADVANKLGLDNIMTDSEEDDMAGLKDSMENFKSAGAELQDGTGKLCDGAYKLSDGTNSLVTGSGNLYQGLVTYTDGVNKAANGAGALVNGATQVDNGVASLQNGIGQLNGGMTALKGGADDLTAGITSLKDGTAGASEGAVTLQAGAEQVSAGVGALVGQMMEIADGMGQAADAASQINAGINQLAAAVSVPTTAEDEAIAGISAYGLVDGETAAAVIWGNVPVDTLRAMGLTDEQIEGVHQVIAGVAGAAVPGMVDQAATGAARAAAVQSANNVKGIVYGALTQNPAGVSLCDGAAALAGNLDNSSAQLTAPEAAVKLQNLLAGAGSVAEGAGSLASGLAELDNGAAALRQGAAQLGQGIVSVQSGAATLSAGAAELKNGTGALKSGALSLSSGVGELNANSAMLLTGSQALTEGAETLKNGAYDLYQGTLDLNSGMLKFNEEGIAKLTALFDTDVDVMRQRIRAIAETAENHGSFSGNDTDEDTSVKFIIESEGIRL